MTPLDTFFKIRKILNNGKSKYKNKPEKNKKKDKINRVKLNLRKINMKNLKTKM